MQAFTQDWFSPHIPIWRQVLGSRHATPQHALEIGCFEGRASLWMLQNVLGHPGSTLTVVDPFTGSPEFAEMGITPDSIEERFDTNVHAFAHKVIKRNGLSCTHLPLLSRQRYDLIYVDGSHRALDAYEDAVWCWRLLNTGGIQIFDDYQWQGGASDAERPRPGIDAFLDFAREECDVLHNGYQVIVQKHTVEEARADLPVLNVITAVSRPRYLYEILEELRALRSLFDVRWILVYAPAVWPVSIHDSWVTHRVHDETGIGGYPQKNVGLSLCRPGWVYILDDDNAIHPVLGRTLRRCIQANPAAKGFVFDQLDVHRTLRLQAARCNVRVGSVDQAQAVFHTDLIGDVRHPIGRYEGDGVFIEHVITRDPVTVRFINEAVTGFNLRGAVPAVVSSSGSGSSSSSHLLPPHTLETR